METGNELHQYQWIVNDGLLRDEGTLYGIAGAGMEEKIEAIREYYRTKKAVSQAKQVILDKNIQDIKGHLSQHSTEGDNMFWNVNASMLQLLFYTSICFFNFWLESYWLSPVFHSTFICIGLYLFGLFSVFIGRSIMYNATRSIADEKGSGDQREKWKIYFEEFGVPLIVSLFITILASGVYPIEKSIVGALFFFMLFLLGGKGLINTFFRARKELSLYFQYLRQKKDRRAKTRELRTLQGDLESAITTLEELNGEEEYKIKTFISEYKLAFESRQLTNGVSMTKLA